MSSMQKIIRSVLMLLLIFGFITCSSLSDKRCRSLRMKMDRVVSKMLFITNPYGNDFRTTQDLDYKYCRPFNSWMSTTRNFASSCLKSYPGAIFEMAVKALKQAYKYNCLTDEMMVTAVRHLQCLTNETSARTKVLSDKFVHYFVLAAKIPDPDNILPAICCGSLEVMSQIRRELRSICRNISGRDTADYLVNLIYACFNDLLVMTCRFSPTIRQCEEDHPEATAYMRSGLATPLSYNYSFMSAMMKGIHRLDRAPPPSSPNRRVQNRNRDNTIPNNSSYLYCYPSSSPKDWQTGKMYRIKTSDLKPN